MHDWLRRRLTYSNAMATIAVFVALGGSSYAAITITGRNVPKNALTGADIKNLTGRDVKNNSLTGADVKRLNTKDVTNGGLLAEDFAPGQLPRGEQGERGPSGIPSQQTLELSGVSANGDHTLTSTGCAILDDPALSSVRIDLPLPAGAQITAVRARYVDTSSDRDIAFGLTHIAFDGTENNTAAIVAGGHSSNSGDGFAELQTDPGVVLPAVSDRSYYNLFANPVTNYTGNLWFCGVAVDYTLAG
jgi:hypothetical protein